MATLSLIILLQLLFLITGDLITAAPVQDICRQTKNPSRCKDILIGFDTRTATAALPVLAEIAIDEVTGGARQVKNRVTDLISKAKDPNLKRNYESCEKLYSGAVDALVSSRQYLKQSNYGKILEAAGIVGRAAVSCAAALGKDKVNEDVGVVAEAVGLIAKNLGKL